MKFPMTVVIVIVVALACSTNVVNGFFGSFIPPTINSNSKSNNDKLCYMLRDDDGDSELNTYDMTVPGLADCLDNLSSQQEEVDYKGFYEAVHQLLKEFKK